MLGKLRDTYGTLQVTRLIKLFLFKYGTSETLVSRFEKWTHDRNQLVVIFRDYFGSTIFQKYEEKRTNR